MSGGPPASAPDARTKPKAPITSNALRGLGLMFVSTFFFAAMHASIRYLSGGDPSVRDRLLPQRVRARRRCALVLARRSRAPPNAAHRPALAARRLQRLRHCKAAGYRVSAGGRMHRRQIE
jgi:hypothetical protein